MERAATFCKYKMKNKINATLVGVLLKRLRFGKNLPVPSWVVPYKIVAWSTWGHNSMEMHDDTTRCGVEQVYKNLLWAHKPWFEAKIDKKRTCLGIAIKEAMSSQSHQQQSSHVGDPTNGCERFLEESMFIPLHTVEMFQSCFLIWSCMLSIHTTFFPYDWVWTLHVHL